MIHICIVCVLTNSLEEDLFGNMADNELEFNLTEP